jgi:hypothetical protein
VRGGQLVNTGRVTVAGRAQTTQEKAEATNEAALGVKSTNDILDYKAALAKASATQKTAIQKAQLAGRQVDAAASKGAGYMVDQNAQPILDANGQRIPFKAPPPKATTKGTPYQKAVGEAKTMVGKPTTYSGKKTMDIVYTDAQGNTNVKTISIKGKYLASPTAKGVYSVPDQYGPGGQPTHYIRTTNDARKAQKQTTMTFDQAVNYLSAHYGITAAKAKAALRAAGWS